MSKQVIACFVLAAFWPSIAARAQVRVSSDFEGGSAVVVSIDDSSQAIHIQPAVRPNRGWPCWWYCRIDGLSVGQPVTLTVSANPLPFRGSQILSHSWLLPDRVAVSVDDVTWSHSAEAKPNGEQAVYAFEATAQTMWAAWGPPFLPSHSDQLIHHASKSVPGAKVFELARTRQGRPVRAIRFGAQPAGQHQPYGVWIQARQHAWESGSSWVAQGFLQWAVGEDPLAVQLRRIATIHVVPVMDVDNVTDGAGGKEAVPRDHNRDWDANPTYPEVVAAQREIVRLDQQQRFDVFVDLHNPGPNDRKPFFYGPKLDELTPLQRRNYNKWQAIAAHTIDDLESRYRFASYIKTTEERNRVSSNWVLGHTSEHAVAMTLETAWNRRQGTTQGYQSVGSQLGRTLAMYLSDDPRRR